MTILTPEVVRTYLEEYDAKKRPPFVYFAFTDQDYLTISQWIADNTRYVNQENAILDYYRKDNDDEQNDK